ncbi:MAG: AbrB/MazE/SpoVT family DNA-binding domain-containing protein [Spirochaetaceae bacterium]|nr:AbrB/MazE/SpoVT family DNA-binding domain-containing protein [Spirochaetaceae bacterium]
MKADIDCHAFARYGVRFFIDILKTKLYNEIIESNASKESDFMELAKITLRGQITIPAEIRKKLGVKDGDKVIFIEENGRIVMENAVRVALKDVQNAFRGEAERLGLKNEQDVVGMVKEVRRKKINKK